VTVAEYIRENSSEKAEFTYYGPTNELENEVMEKYNIPHKGVFCGKLYRYMTLKYFLEVLKLPIGVLQSLFYMLIYMPDVVFAKGGFASVPVVIAARMYRIPVLVHESDSIPGLANKFLGSICNKIAITFERSRIYFPVHKTVLTGVPVKKDALGGDAQSAREKLGIHKEVKPILFVIGGSQGAQLINEKILLNLKELLKSYQIIHQTGKAHFEFAKKEAERMGYKIGHDDYYPIDFITDGLSDIMALADVVISRAGSTAITELAANKIVSILIPITKSANNHQRINAFEVSKVGGAIVLEESNFRKSMMMHNLSKLMNDEELRNKLSENIQKFYHSDAAEVIAKELVEMARK
jgi:UDP-N-acetylglucosamine--N-acetylmuramyl-(pentapeptide) pyrophosphoryl-undecaprenol N-acetylglucosamine transferase